MHENQISSVHVKCLDRGVACTKRWAEILIAFIRVDKSVSLRSYHLVMISLGNVVTGLTCTECAFLQSARDIESKMRNETRLKLFTLDADTQVKDSK